jgi:cytochrome c oxidase subunit II
LTALRIPETIPDKNGFKNNMKKTAKTWLWSLLSAPAFVTLYSIAAQASAPDGAVIGQPVPGEIGLQPSASPMRDQMIHFHDDILLPLITAIAFFVFALLVIVIVRFNERANPVPSKTTHNTMLEIVWTMVPVLILVLMAIPSIKILYYADRTHDADMTLKVTGHQWYWEYTYPDNGDVNFNSNLIPNDKIDKSKGQVRLLSTDEPVVLPVNTNIRLLITATDVIHSWSVPAFGVKLDAVPGRTNETWTRIEKEGTFYGQCSQLCGDGHGFMPIEVRAVSAAEYANWIHSKKGKMPGEVTKAASNAPAPAAAPANKKEEKAGEH